MTHLVETEVVVENKRNGHQRQQEIDKKERRGEGKLWTNMGRLTLFGTIPSRPAVCTSTGS